MRFRLKITLSMLCLTALLFGIGGSALISISFQNAVEQQKSAVTNHHQMLLSTLVAAGNMGGQKGTPALLRTLEMMSVSGNPAWSAIILSSGTEVLYENGEVSSCLRDFHEQVGTENSLISYFTDTEGNPFLQFSAAFTSGGEELYLDTAYSLSALYAARNHQQSAYQKILLGMLTLCAVAAYSISYMLTLPLNRLSRASRQLASGNLAYRSKIHSNDEIGELSEDFDAMAEKLEQNVAELKASMERQERFMSSFAHEMKTPMTSIIGYADLLRSQELTAQERAEAAGYIFTEGKRLDNLSLKLLDIFVTGQSELQRRPVSPLNISRELVAQLEPIYNRSELHISAEGDEGLCLLDDDLLLSLLHNLMENARRAAKPGGFIKIQVELLPDGCRLYVLDNGRGIPPEALSHLTEAFYRVDKSRSRKQGGTGLGLALCLKIVELHNGTLRFESKPGVGTCVIAELKGERQ